MIEQKTHDDYVEVKEGRLSITNIIESILETKARISREQEERSYQRFQENTNTYFVEEEKVSPQSFQGYQSVLLTRFSENIQYPVYLKYIEPYERCAEQGLFIKLNEEFTFPSQKGNLEELAAGIDIYLDKSSITLNFLGTIRCRIKYLDDEKGKYIELGKTETACLASTAILALSTGQVNAFYDALIEQLSGLLPYDPGDVELAGYDKVVERCEQIISHNNPLTMKRNILLAGPPGCGKSMIMKQVARNHPEAIRCNLTRSEGWLRWINLFSKMLEKCNKRVLLFVDEIDELGLTRDRDRESVYELLRLMDGMENTKNLVIVASTNRVEDLDPALLREGRFGPVIYVGYPDIEQKRAIIEFYGARYDSKLDSDMILEHLEGDVSGAGIRLTVEDCLVSGNEITTMRVIENLKRVRNSGESATNFMRDVR